MPFVAMKIRRIRLSDFQLALMCGCDIPLAAFQTVIHPLTMREIGMMGETEFFEATNYLCLEKEWITQDKIVLETYSNFQIFMKVLQDPASTDKKESVHTLLSLLFPLCSVSFTPNSILLYNKELKQATIIEDNNFSEFQAIIKQVLCLGDMRQGDNITYNPANERAKRIADKLMKSRLKIAEIKNNKKESALTKYISILCVGNKMPLSECLELTLFQLFDLMERFSLYSNWDNDFRVRLAGGDAKKEAENWMKNLH